MSSIVKSSLPEKSLLYKYQRRDGCYTDCFSTEVDHEVSFPEFVTTFYCTPLFKIERFILKVVINRPSTDEEADKLGHGKIDAFAAWTVEDRSKDQLLMCDINRRTRSWFMIEPIKGAPDSRTKLYFGSAVVPAKAGGSGEPSLGFLYSSLLGFHKLYSRALLWSAKAGL